MTPVRVVAGTHGAQPDFGMSRIIVTAPPDHNAVHGEHGELLDERHHLLEAAPPHGEVARRAEVPVRIGAKNVWAYN